MNSKECKPLFVYNERKLLYSDIERLIDSWPPVQGRQSRMVYRVHEGSREGRNRCRPDVKCVVYILVDIQLYYCLAGSQLEGKEQANLGDILKFLTGARTIPPRGYAYNRRLSFGYSERAYPVSSSCFLHITLPLGCSSYTEFCTCTKITRQSSTLAACVPVHERFRNVNAAALIKSVTW
jgi:hypothetical protein